MGIKISNWPVELEPPSEKVIAEDKRRYVSSGFDLLEGEAAQASKLQRQKNLFESMRWDTKQIDENLKFLKEKAEAEDVKAKDLNPLDGEIKKLRKDFREYKLLADLRGMRENRKALNGFKSVIQDKKGLEDISGTLSLIESFYEGSLSAENLLVELEKKGIFNL